MNVRPQLPPAPVPAIWRQVDLPNALTLAGLVATLGEVVSALHGRWPLAFALLVVAGLVDLFDGVLARRLAARRSELVRSVGQHLDSLVDACAFGLGPAVLAYCSGVRGPAGFLALSAFVAAAVLRLGYFEARGPVAAGGPAFVGMPVTYVALLVPLGYLPRACAGLLPMLRTASPLDGVTEALPFLVLAALMVSPLPFSRPTGKGYAGLGLVALGELATFGWATVAGSLPQELTGAIALPLAGIAAVSLFGFRRRREAGEP